ncbi:MAG: HAD-IIIC family phosphatase [Acidobacteria bacterium]|nr:HAD-IIIC family phosphatase [Acidobacteriota bacterium]
MPQDRAIAISATFTAEPIRDALAFWMRELEMDYEIRFAGYNQVFQELLNPAGLFAGNTGGVNVVLARLADWRAEGWGELQEAAAKSPAAAPLIVVVCPSPGAAPVEEGPAGLPYVILPGEVAALYPVAGIHDPHGDELGHVPYTPEYFAALASAIARKVHALRMPPYKVIALDCDDTLWSGICGEDGPQAVVLDAPRRALQQFMAARRAEGMLLALCSKNNEEDVAETFRAHPDMPLQAGDFAASRVNWQSKGANLVELAGELGLGLDSFLLVDDNPKEIDEARAGAPEVLGLALPADAGDIPEFLRHVWAFDRARVTEEDRKRGDFYAQQAARTRAARGAGSLEEFLAGLRLEVRIAPLEAGQIERVAQLTQRTNQMNATCLRRTAAEIARLSAECLTVTVSDRFGGYGLTGAILFRAEERALAVDTFLLSCRALGRGVEHRMVARLGEIALERGLARVEIPFLAAQRNRPARLFLESIAAAGADGVFRLPAAEAAGCVYRPPEAAPAIGGSTEEGGRTAPRRPDYGRIARELRTPAAVMERLRSAARVTARPADPPRTALERDLAQLWSELLNVTGVGVHDNFFELGGHSLLAVQLLSRVRQIYGIELSLEVVYSGEFTVAELAKAIELKEIEQAGGDYHELLEELEGLSDEEVRTLLAEEQDAT